MTRKVTRVIEIEGDDAWVESTLNQSYIQPTLPRDFGKGTLKEIARIEGGSQVAVVISKVDQS